MGRLVHFGATAAYGGSWVDGLWKWLKLVPNFLMRPSVDPVRCAWPFIVSRIVAVDGDGSSCLTSLTCSARSSLRSLQNPVQTAKGCQARLSRSCVLSSQPRRARVACM